MKWIFVAMPKEAQPIIDEMNKIGKEIAKKHGMRHSNFSFAGLMR